MLMMNVRRFEWSTLRTLQEAVHVSTLPGRVSVWLTIRGKEGEL